MTLISETPRTETASTETAGTQPRRVTGVPEGAEVRGFALYVGIDEAKAAANGVEIAELVERLKALVHDLAPDAGTHAAAAIAPVGAGGRDIDVVRAALRDPGLTRRADEAAASPRRRTGVVVDISRKRVVLDGETAPPRPAPSPPRSRWSSSRRRRRIETHRQQLGLDTALRAYSTRGLLRERRPGP